MKGVRYLQLKAAFLLIVFSMNMIVGFACAVHLKTWFNSTHHKGLETIEKSSHHHDKANQHHGSKECNDSCCNDHVIKLAQSDKSFPQGFAGLNGIFFTTLITSFFNIDASSTKEAGPNIKCFVRGHHPPIPDIRIAIQSFQI